MKPTLTLALLLLISSASPDPWMNGRHLESGRFNFNIDAPDDGWQWRITPPDPAHPDRLELFCIQPALHQLYRVRAERDVGQLLTEARVRQLATDRSPGAIQTNMRVERADLAVDVPSYRVDYDLSKSGPTTHVRTYMVDAITHFEISAVDPNPATFDAFAHSFHLNVSYVSLRTGGDMLLSLIGGAIAAAVLACAGLGVWLVRRRRRAGATPRTVP